MIIFTLSFLTWERPKSWILHFGSTRILSLRDGYIVGEFDAISAWMDAKWVEERG